MAWVWIVFLAFFVFLAVGIFAALKVFIAYENKRRAAEIPERTLGSYDYDDREWEAIYRNEFDSEPRGRSLLDPYWGSIGISGDQAGKTKRSLTLTNRYIYITGDGVRKSFKIQHLNPGGSEHALQSVRALHLSPMRKLQVNVLFSQRVESQRIDNLLEYLIPLPESAANFLTEIENFYGDVILNDGQNANSV